MSKIVWFEMPADDTARAREFYSGLFGWQFEAFEGPFEYHMANEAGGAVYPSQGERGPIVYFGADDIDAAVARVRELGGTAEGKEEIPHVGLFARCVDTEGNPFSLFQAPQGSSS